MIPEKNQQFCEMNKKLVIAIDGFSSTGKSSISKIIAKKLGLIHLDTGALYRGITYFALNNAFENDRINFPQLYSKFKDINLHFENIDGEMVLFLNDEDISHHIRKQSISENVSEVAKQKEVRDFLLEIQRKMAEKGGVIMDGRDIGTVILPNADFKFFMTASPEERAKRRFLELEELNIPAKLPEVHQNLLERDKIDSEREIAPLKQAEDSILIDNTHLTRQQTIDKILSYLI